MAESKLLLRSRDDVLAFLKGKPRYWSVVLASRVSLRLLPLVLDDPDGHSQPNAALMLAVLRANFIVWVASQSEEYALTLSAAAADSAGAEALQANLSENDAAYAAAVAAHVVTYAATLDPTGYAAGALGVEKVAGTSAMDALSADAERLMSLGVKSGADLARQRLWLIEVRDDPTQKTNMPRWARKPFDIFDHSELVTEGPWKVWLAWYREILPNHLGPPRLRQFTPDLAFKIASQPSKFWTGDPHRVTADIAKMVGHKWPEKEWKWPKEEGSEAPQPDNKKKASRKFGGRMPAPPPKPKPPAPIETVGIHSDEPTDEDQLGRWPFAKALAEHMDDVYWQQKAKAESAGGNSEDGDGFAMHIHAPWGAGKTSVIKMMRKMLERSGRPSKNGRIAPQWIMVEFNA